MISMWAWEERDVIPGESAGVCVSPAAAEESVNSSCWLWTMNEEGVYEETNTSYLLDPYIVFTPETRLEDQTTASTFQVPAMFGNWICTRPMEVAMRIRTTCARFLPRDDTPEDPVY